MVLNFLLDILVSLQDLVVLNLSFLETLVHPQFKSFLVGCHFVGLLLHQLGLRGEDFLMPHFFVRFTFLSSQLHDTTLNLMSFLIVLLLSQVLLDLLKVEQLGGCFKFEREFFFKMTPIFLELFGVALIHSVQLVLVGLAQLKQLPVPVLVEVLVLFDMGVFALLSLLLVSKCHLVHLPLVVLLLQLRYPILAISASTYRPSNSHYERNCSVASMNS